MRRGVGVRELDAPPAVLAQRARKKKQDKASLTLAGEDPTGNITDMKLDDGLSGTSGPALHSSRTTSARSGTLFAKPIQNRSVTNAVRVAKEQLRQSSEVLAAVEVPHTPDHAPTCVTLLRQRSTSPQGDIIPSTQVGSTTQELVAVGQAPRLPSFPDRLCCIIIREICRPNLI